MSSPIRIAGILAAPLVLGGCGLPIAAQVASLFADGISYLTTEKTLTDHGISTIADKDCALWRGVQGEEICRDNDEGEVIAAALSEPADTAQEQPLGGDQEFGGDADIPTALMHPATPAVSLAAASDAAPPYPLERQTIAIVAYGKSSQSGIGSAAPPANADDLILGTPVQTQANATDKALPKVRAIGDTAVAKAEPTQPVETSTETQQAMHLKPAPRKPVANAQPVSLPAAKITSTVKPRATYMIIASYHRIADAQRFSGRHAALQPRVLEGHAKGRQVFRVAVGPLAKDERLAARRKLIRAGFSDTWKLTLNTPKVVTEMASAR